MAWEPPAHPARNVKITNTVPVKTETGDEVDVGGSSLESIEATLLDVVQELRLTNELLKGILQ